MDEAKGFKLIRKIRSQKIAVAKFDSSDAADAFKEAQAAKIAIFEPDYVVNAIRLNTPEKRELAESTPYGIINVKAASVPDDNTDAIKICVADTGYDLDHPDLPKGDAVTGTTQQSTDWDTDPNSHGTHVAGTIAAIGGNGIGVKGVISNGNVKLHISKVLNNRATGSTSEVIAGYEDCVANGAKVINMSLGGGGASSSFQNAITSAYNQGVVTVAAAGNNNSRRYFYPASYDHVVSVASVDSSNVRSSFSNYNDKVDIAAPGSGVLSTVNGGGYASFSGTSMASPHVAGVAALVWSTNPSLSNQNIMDILENSATDLGESGYDNLYGHGLVNAEAAYNLAQSPQISPAPTPAPEVSCNIYSNSLSCQPVDGCFWYPARSKCLKCSLIQVENNCNRAQCTWTGSSCE